MAVTRPLRMSASDLDPPVRDIRLLKTARVDTRETERLATEREWFELCRQVDARDHFRCRACGCRVVKTLTMRANRTERHHVIPRSRGGKDTTQNVCTLCLSCHGQRHITQTLLITGDADSRLTFEKGGKIWHG